VSALPEKQGMTAIEVDCQSSADGWTCDVTVADDDSRSRHTVRVRREDLARLDPAAADPSDVVRRSFVFLLEREPPESILRSFDLTVIGRYFPEYESAIRR
jgi:hypothetical protein